MNRVEKEIRVNAPVETVYNAWTDFERFPRFMANVEQVSRDADDRLFWKASVGPTGTREWHAQVTEMVPNERVAWRSVDGDYNAGTVLLFPEDGGTRLKVTFEYDPPAGPIGELADKVFQITPGSVEDDLKRFKEMIEAQPVSRVE